MRGLLTHDKARHVLTALGWMCLGGFLVWFFTPQPVATGHHFVQQQGVQPIMVEREPPKTAISTVQSKAEKDAIDRCVKEQNGRPVMFTRSGANCYIYFPSDQSFSIPDPPADNKAEAMKLVEMKSKRNAKTIAEINSQSLDFRPEFWKVAGIDPGKNPEFEEMIRLVTNDSINLTLKVKSRFERTRPHVVNPDVTPVIVVPWHSAYPSGHATQAALFAHIFACANPSAKEDLERLAISVGRNREIAGVHYPSDTDAGFQLGRMMFEALAKNPKFSCKLSK